MFTFSGWNIGKRLAVGFSLMLALAVVIAAVGVSRLDQTTAATAEVLAVPLAKERVIDEWHMMVYSGVRRIQAIVKSSDPALGAYFKEDGAYSASHSAELMKQIVPLIAPGEEQALWDRIGVAQKAFGKAREAAMQAKADGNQELAAQILDQQVSPAAKAYLDGIQELVAMQRTHISSTTGQLLDEAHAGKRLIIVLSACAVVFGALSSILLTRGIVRPIREAVEVAETVANGDLTRRIESASGDETGALLRALRHMNDSLVRIVGDVRGGTTAIHGAAGEISAGNLDLSSRTEQQAAALEETAASMAHLTDTVRQNADNARQANQLSIAASSVAADGGAVVAQVVQTMGSINASSKKIVDIISVIDGIAFQTNILALNAAVEAARAGEQGRGFAVVASEVRTLAQRSAAAAKEIKTLIDDSVGKVDAGTRLVDQAGSTMEQVVESIRRVTDIMAEIAAASQEQTTGIEQVNQAIGQMDQTTQQNAALVEEAAAAAGSLQDQASRLAQAVDLFKLDRGMAGPAVATAAREPTLRLARAGAVSEWETF